MAILLANVCCSTAALLNPPALRAAPFAKGGSWVPSFVKGGTGKISPAGSSCFIPISSQRPDITIRAASSTKFSIYASLRVCVRANASSDPKGRECTARTVDLPTRKE
jgi:hypothetical protein